jgi:hypothetical protein
MNVTTLAKINLGMFYMVCVIGILMGNTHADIACLVASNVISHVYCDWKYNDDY